jgi:uracil-DNA glycosylase family 4
MKTLSELNINLIACEKCPRLTEWREDVAVKKRKSYQDQDYCGKPVTGFGVAKPKLLVVGLAPGAHGANRTGRIFTGDRSGDWLYRALYKAQFANQPTSQHIKDGLKLIQARVLTAVRCAPPDNKPSNQERDNCRSWLTEEWQLIKRDVKCVVALGGFAWQEAGKTLLDDGYLAAERLPKFRHLAQIELSKGKNKILVIASYHPSQQNTFTKRLTEPMFDQVFTLARQKITDS